MSISKFTISIDFELNWGVADTVKLSTYYKNILGERIAVPKILQLFKLYNIETTWAVVGFSTFENKKDLLSYTPSVIPIYNNQNRNNYLRIRNIGVNEKQDPFHFGYSLFNEILNTPNTEIATHTFSHYYCLEKKQNEEFFQTEIDLAISRNMEFGKKTKSIIFPRNQYSPYHLDVLYSNNILFYRGNQHNRSFRTNNYEKYFSITNRILRNLNSYVGIYDNVTKFQRNSNLFNITETTFFYPYNNYLSFFEKFKVNKIKKDMLIACLNNNDYHLWWHPHNFGINIDKNMHALTEIIIFYKYLENKYGMVNKCMSNIIL